MATPAAAMPDQTDMFEKRPELAVKTPLMWLSALTTNNQV